jgi:hypothetical protein
MTSIKTTARIAGFLYLVQIPIGVFGLLYIPKRLMVKGNIAATALNILANEFLFRLSIVSAILCALLSVATALYIYKVLRYVDENFAKWILLYALIATPISMLNELNNVAVLILLKSHEYAAIFTSGQLHNLVLSF